MRELFKKYRAVIRFIVLFMGAYLLLSFFYAVYLKISATGNYSPDFITNLVARQSRAVLESIGFTSTLAADTLGEGVILTIENNFTAVIVEGCNSVSVIILFVSFIVAFAERFQKTLLFLFAGSVLIYIVNVLRIVLLTVALYKYPQYENILHSVVFPGIIYSMVFILWMVWAWKLKPKVSE